jgi:outer membrane protein assembly factor BamB
MTGPDAGNARLWADGDRVFLAAGERLEARALATSALAWPASMSDAIHSACRQCLAAGAGRVVVLAADGVVQAFDGATGRALWRASTRLNRPIAPDLEIAGDLVSVVDRGPGTGAVELALLRADSGEPVRRIRPACAASPWADTTQALHDGDRVILALGRAGVAACFEAWEVRRGARLWQAALPRPGTRIDESRVPWYVASGRSLALAKASIGPGERGTVWALALDTGRLRSLPVAEGYETRVLDARDGVLLLRATRQRRTVRDELWAMDLDRGSVLWDNPFRASAARWRAGRRARCQWRRSPRGARSAESPRLRDARSPHRALAGERHRRGRGRGLGKGPHGPTRPRGSRSRRRIGWSSRRAP